MRSTPETSAATVAVAPELMTLPGAGVRGRHGYQGRPLTRRPHPLLRALLMLIGRWHRDGAGP